MHDQFQSDMDSATPLKMLKISAAITSFFHCDFPIGFWARLQWAVSGAFAMGQCAPYFHCGSGFAHEVKTPGLVGFVGLFWVRVDMYQVSMYPSGNEK